LARFLAQVLLARARPVKASRPFLSILKVEAKTEKHVGL
jgi:hypothetical protein